MKSGKIIQIADLINDKLRKEQELEFYELELKKLLLRMQFVRQEIDLTNTIIDLNSGNIRLLATPTSSNSTVFKVFRTTMNA